MMGGDRVLGLATAWKLDLLPVPALALEKEVQGAGVHVSGNCGRVVTCKRQSSALRSREAGKPHECGGKQKPAAV